MYKVECIVVISNMTLGNPNLRQFDLNLVNALAVLLEEGSVTGAAHRLGLTQPALSRMLSRLRAMFDDPLLVKVGRSMMPTPRAAALQTPLRSLLIEMSNLIRPAEFDPQAARGVVRIAATDGATESVVTPWIRSVSALSPGLSFELTAITPETPIALSRGETDFAVDVYPDPIEGCHATHLFYSHFVCVLRKDHPVARSGITRRTYAQLHHIQVTGTGGGGSILDQELARLGISRKIAVRMPSITAAPFVASQTDWALTIPSMRARISAPRFPIRILPLPFQIRAIPMSLLWHERTRASPLHEWMRSRLAALHLRSDVVRGRSGTRNNRHVTRAGGRVSRT